MKHWESNFRLCVINKAVFVMKYLGFRVLRSSIWSIVAPEVSSSSQDHWLLRHPKYSFQCGSKFDSLGVEALKLKSLVLTSFVDAAFESNREISQTQIEDSRMVFVSISHKIDLSRQSPSIAMDFNVQPEREKNSREPRPSRHPIIIKSRP